MEILLHEEGFEIALRLVLKVDMFKLRLIYYKGEMEDDIMATLIVYKQKAHLKGPTFATIGSTSKYESCQPI